MHCSKMANASVLEMYDFTVPNCLVQGSRSHNNKYDTSRQHWTSTYLKMAPQHEIAILYYTTHLLPEPTIFVATPALPQVRLGGWTWRKMISGTITFSWHPSPGQDNRSHSLAIIVPADLLCLISKASPGRMKGYSPGCRHQCHS